MQGLAEAKAVLVTEFQRESKCDDLIALIMSDPHYYTSPFTDESWGSMVG